MGFFLADLIDLIEQPPVKWMRSSRLGYHGSIVYQRCQIGFTEARKSRTVVARSSDKYSLTLRGIKFTAIKVVDLTLHDCPGEAGPVKNLWEATMKHLGLELTHGALEQAFIQIITKLR